MASLQARRLARRVLASGKLGPSMAREVSPLTGEEPWDPVRLFIGWVAVMGWIVFLVLVLDWVLNTIH
jgi:hypothetical protein